MAHTMAQCAIQTAVQFNLNILILLLFIIIVRILCACIVYVPDGIFSSEIIASCTCWRAHLVGERSRMWFVQAASVYCLVQLFACARA